MKKFLITTALLAAAFLAAGCPANVNDLAADGDLPQLEQQVKKDPAKINARDTEGRTPLHAACQAGQTGTVRWLIANGAKVDIADERGETPLHSATRGQHLDICRMLVEAGADPKAQDKSGETPLHYAASRNVELTGFFLDSGVPIDIEDKSGDAPLVKSTLFGKIEVARFLLERGADVNHQDIKGKTALQIYVESGPFIQAMNGMMNPKAARFDLAAFEEMIDFLVGSGAKLDLADNEGLTPLHAAAVSSRCNDVQVGSPRPGITTVALQMGENPDAVRILVGLGAPVDARDNKGRTPLHNAVINQHEKCVKELIKAGADVNARDDDGKTPMDYTDKCPACASHLKEAGAEK